MAGAGRPPTTLLRPTPPFVDGGVRLIGGKIRRWAPVAVPFIMAAVGPPSTPCSAYFRRSRGWRAFARHDVVATAVSPTCILTPMRPSAAITRRHGRVAPSAHGDWQRAA